MAYYEMPRQKRILIWWFISLSSPGRGGVRYWFGNGVMSVRAWNSDFDDDEHE